MKLFGKGKGDSSAPAQGAAAFQPIDRTGLLGLLDQVVNSGQSGVLELQEPRGSWVYAFQAGALTHASGGRVRGARQAFDLLWEFQQGQFKYVPGVNQTLASNLYIDKARLLEMLRRSQAALQGPASPYIPADQQRPIPQRPPAPGVPAWNVRPPGAYPPSPAGYPPAPATGYPPAQPATYPPQPPPSAPYPQRAPSAPYPQPAPSAPYPQPAPAAPYPQPAPAAGYPPAGSPGAPPAAPFQPFVQAQPSRPPTPPSFSVPPMPLPKKAAPAAPAPMAAQPPAPVVAPAEAPKAAPVDDLKALRASLVAQAPAAGAPPATAWKVRTVDGAVAPTPAAGARAGKGGKGGKVKAAKKQSRLGGAIELQLIKFLLWACERSYSPDDHWTLKDAFEVSTMELRDQFVGAFSQSFKAAPKGGIADEVDELAAGRMRGRAKPRKR